jgi:hypothetical protein
LWIGDSEEQKKRLGEAFNHAIPAAYEHHIRRVMAETDLEGIVQDFQRPEVAQNIALIIINAHGAPDGSVHDGISHDGVTAEKLAFYLARIRANLNEHKRGPTLVAFGQCYGHVTRNVAESWIASTWQGKQFKGRLEFRAFTDDGKTSTYSAPDNPSKLLKWVHEDLNVFLAGHLSA